MFRYCMMVLCLVGVCLWPALAAEVPPLTAAEFADTPVAAVSALNAAGEAHWIWTVLASEIVAVIAGWICLQIVARFRDSRYLVAIEAIRDAVTACYHEYVREIKAASEDGKLTVEEKNTALRKAYEAAVEFARTRGIDLLKVFAKETVMRIIEKYVGESKARAVAAPLSDSAPLPDSVSHGVMPG